MSIWEQYSREQREEYIKFLQVYGALTNLFRQKKGDLIPYLDSKYQETIFAKSFKGQNVDIGNTPHDILSVFGNKRVGIGLKTWMGSHPSFQKVMQLKRYQSDINLHINNLEDLAYVISEIRNEKLLSDYERLGLNEDDNIYHYVTRDRGSFTINECAYPLIDLNSLRDFKKSKTAFTWSDGNKDYKYTFGDSQIWQKFDSNKYKSILLEKFEIKIIADPFSFLLQAYLKLLERNKEAEVEIEEVYLPLYSFRTKEVEQKSGLNAWNGAPKVKGSNKPRPPLEAYIPIPKAFHYKYPDFFTKNILKVIEDRKLYRYDKDNRPEVRFRLELPNGKSIPALITGDNLKNFQSGSKTEKDENNRIFGQSALGNWLFIDVLRIKPEQKRIITREMLQKNGSDSVRVWKKKNDYTNFYIDLAPVGSFEAFMNDEPITEDLE